MRGGEAQGVNKDIEVLRAVAVGAVLAQHANGALVPALAPTGVGQFFQFFNLGGGGVDLFFVISGFVIGRSLLPRLQSASTAAQRRRETFAFWTRRAFRLLPTAWLWLAIILAVTAGFSFADPQLAFGVNVDATVAGVLYFANFRFAEAWGHFPMGASFHYWTLSLEEQFYLLLPLVVLLTRRWLPLALVLLIAIDLLRPPGAIAMVTRASGLLVGVLIALWSMRESFAQAASVYAKLPRWIALVLSLAALAAVFRLDLFLNERNQIVYGAVALAAGVCVLAAAFNRDILCPDGPWRRFSLWMGARSYSLYVIHIPLFMVINDTLQQRAPYPWAWSYSAVVLVGGLAALAVLTELNFRLVETPLRRVGARLSARITGTEQSLH